MIHIEDVLFVVAASVVATVALLQLGVPYQLPGVIAGLLAIVSGVMGYKRTVEE